jgi:hypothetical protein
MIRAAASEMKNAALNESAARPVRTSSLRFLCDQTDRL